MNSKAATATWTGTASNLWSGPNWVGGLGAGGAPATTGDALLFTAATGVGGLTLTDDLMTPGTYTIAGITFNAGSGAYVINPATPGINGFTLAGNLTNGSTSTQTIKQFHRLVGQFGLECRSRWRRQDRDRDQFRH